MSRRARGMPPTDNDYQPGIATRTRARTERTGNRRNMGPLAEYLEEQLALPERGTQWIQMAAAMLPNMQSLHEGLWHVLLNHTEVPEDNSQQDTLNIALLRSMSETYDDRNVYRPKYSRRMSHPHNTLPGLTRKFRAEEDEADVAPENKIDLTGGHDISPPKRARKARNRPACCGCHTPIFVEGPDGSKLPLWALRCGHIVCGDCLSEAQKRVNCVLTKTNVLGNAGIHERKRRRDDTASGEEPEAVKRTKNRKGERHIVSDPSERTKQNEEEYPVVADVARETLVIPGPHCRSGARNTSNPWMNCPVEGCMETRNHINKPNKRGGPWSVYY